MHGSVSPLNVIFYVEGRNSFPENLAVEQSRKPFNLFCEKWDIYRSKVGIIFKWNLCFIVCYISVSNYSICFDFHA